MSKQTRMRNLALLGGLGAAAMLMGKKKTDSDYEEQDKQEGYESTPVKEKAPTKVTPIPASKPKAKAEQKDEGVTASGLPREARGVKPPQILEGTTASGLPREARGVRPQKDEGATASGLPREARGVRAPDRMRTAEEEAADDEKIFRATGVRPRPAIDRIRGGMKAGGKVKKMAGGGTVSKRADGCAIRGKTRGRVM